MARLRKPTDERLFLLIRNWLNIYLPVERASSQHTMKSYRESLNQYLHFLSSERNIALSTISFDMINADSLNRYLDWLQTELKLSKATRNLRLAAIRAFIDYASACSPEYITIAMNVAKIKTQKDDLFSKVAYLTEKATKAILSSPDLSSWMGRRDFAMLTMLYDTGARIDELLKIQLKDLRLDDSSPTVKLYGKGGVIRAVPLSKENQAILIKYISEFHEDYSATSDVFLFYVSHRNGLQRMHPDTVRRRIQAYADKARVKCPEIPKRIHPHMWRHTRAMHLYQHGMPLELVSQWLGHKSSTTTLIYAHADTEHKRAAIEKAMKSVHLPETIADVDEKYTVSDENILKQLYGLK